MRTDSNPNGSFVWRWGRITITLQLLLALLLAHTPGLRGQETPVPSEISFDATGRVSVRVTASPDTYSVLFRGNELQSIPDPIAVEVEGNAPGDLDQDGVDDLYELLRRPTLHPLIATDAVLDHEGDRRATFDEYRVGTDPLVFDVAPGTAAVPMPTLNTPFDPTPTNPAKPKNQIFINMLEPAQ